jgi:hypothetical protein
MGLKQFHGLPDRSGRPLLSFFGIWNLMIYIVDRNALHILGGQNLQQCINLIDTINTISQEKDPDRIE